MKCHSSFCFVIILSLATSQAVPTSKVTSEVPEKKTTDREDVIANKTEITEEIPAITVDEAEESQAANRAKKSATTTFCVEIHPEPSEPPVQICDNHPTPSAPVRQISQISHGTNEKPPPPSPENYVDESEDSISIIPPSNPEFFITNKPSAPQNFYPNFLHFSQFFHQQPSPQQNVILPSVASNIDPQAFPSLPQQNIIIPATVSNAYPQFLYPPSPCSARSGSGLHPEILQPLFRSFMMPSRDGKLSSFDGTGMRSIGMDSGAMIPMEMKYTQNFESEILEAPFVKTHVKDLYGGPSSSYYPSNVYNLRYPYVVRNNPQLLSSGRSSDGSFFDINSNEQSITAPNGHMNVDMSQKARHHGMQPFSQRIGTTAGGYQSHSITPSVVQHTPYQSYQYLIHPYRIHHHSALSGYPVNSQQSNVVRPNGSINSRPEIISPAINNAYRKNQQFENKSWNAKAENRESTDEKNRLEESVPTMTPSQILNQMRKNDGFSGFDKNPTTQSFPRVNDNRSNNNGFAANTPCGSKPFMIAGSRSINDKNSNIDGERIAMHDEMGKREVEKSSNEKKD